MSEQAIVLDKPIMEAHSLPTFTAVGFIVALLALVLAFTAIYRTNVVLIATQVEVLALNKRIQDLSKMVPAPQQAPAAKIE